MTIDLRKPQQHQVRDHAIRLHDAPRQVGEPVREVPRRANPRRSKERAVMLFAAAIIAIILLVLLGYGVSKAWGRFFGGSEYEIRSLVSHVGEHMVLPEGETPTLATVTDMHALEGQLFFKNAAVGDKVIIYMQAQKAILYRPSIDKIIEVGPVTATTP